MKIEEEIKQSKFKSEYQKATINILFTASWINNYNLQYLKPHGITGPQYNVLRILRGRLPELATINTIADRMIDPSSNASRIVDKLVEKGLAERIQHKEDKRIVNVAITEKGLEVLRTIDPAFEQIEKTRLGLNEEEAQMLNTLLDKIRTQQS